MTDVSSGKEFKYISSLRLTAYISNIQKPYMKVKVLCSRQRLLNEILRLLHLTSKSKPIDISKQLFRECNNGKYEQLVK